MNFLTIDNITNARVVALARSREAGHAVLSTITTDVFAELMKSRERVLASGGFVELGAVVNMASDIARDLYLVRSIECSGTSVTVAEVNSYLRDSRLAAEEDDEAEDPSSDYELRIYRRDGSEVDPWDTDVPQMNG